MIVTLLALHVLSATFWVGGMVFAYWILRPAAAALEPAQRLPLWRGVFASFLPKVGFAIILLLVTGFWLVFAAYGGFAALPMPVHLMMGTGVLMMLLFLHLVAAPWKRFRTTVDAGDFAAAANHLNRIRVTVGINMLLGLATIAIAATGRYW